jgi:hypothetical protein
LSFLLFIPNPHHNTYLCHPELILSRSLPNSLLVPSTNLTDAPFVDSSCTHSGRRRRSHICNEQWTRYPPPLTYPGHEPLSRVLAALVRIPNFAHPQRPLARRAAREDPWSAQAHRAPMTVVGSFVLWMKSRIYQCEFYASVFFPTENQWRPRIIDVGNDHRRVMRVYLGFFGCQP